MCTAKCYDAVGPDCDCICQGANHGRGEGKARENTHEMGLICSRQASASTGHRRRRFVVPPEQGELFSFLQSGNVLPVIL